MIRNLPLALFFSLLAGCSALDGRPGEDAFGLFSSWYRDYRTCRQEYAAMDARVALAGVGDAGYYRVPGYPYFRTDRVLASFAREVRTIDQIGGWMRRMRELDQEAREFEYLNLGLSVQEAAEYRHRFLSCGAALVAVEFIDNPKAFAHLVSVAKPRDEYSTTQRVLALYAVTAPGMRARVEAQQAALDASYRQPLEDLEGSAPLTLWKPRIVDDLPPVGNVRLMRIPDELGFPALTDGQWRALAQEHAPQLWIETASARDELAQPILTPGGASADTSRHRAHYYITFTRVTGRLLPQINYLFWFPGEGRVPSLDGFIWRVTLDAAARPLVYESVHTSGHDHEWYPVQALVPRKRNGDDEEAPVIAPQAAPAHLPTLRLSATTHAIRRVMEPIEAPAGARQIYEIERFEDLFLLPAPGGGTRSLFGPEGLVAGPHGSDPIGGLSSGIRRPGALRQLGRHAIAHVGRAHFDDPFLLESVFDVPPPALGEPVAGTLGAEAPAAR